MSTQTKHPPYKKVRDLLKDLDGEMKWRPGGGGGGVWELNLRGKTRLIEVRDNQINDLDRLYVPEVDSPKTSLDYGHPGRLVDDAFWRLVDLFRRPVRRPVSGRQA